MLSGDSMAGSGTNAQVGKPTLLAQNLWGKGKSLTKNPPSASAVANLKPEEWLPSNHNRTAATAAAADTSSAGRMEHTPIHRTSQYSSTTDISRPVERFCNICWVAKPHEKS